MQTDTKSKGINLRRTRYAVQAFFLVLTLVIGYRFYAFASHFEGQGHGFIERPPSVDSFLPIAGMMSFKNFLFTGVVEQVHPAAMVMFSAIVVVSILMKKGFCGWICPVGTLSQYSWMGGRRIFGKNPAMWRYADIPLRSVKYLVMAFFIYAIWIKMGPDSSALFFQSEYYKTADVRTMRFFTDMTPLTFKVLAGIGALSLIYKNFWCRYLCPYGALLGLLGRLSPVKVRRNEENCIHCHACTKNCPTLIDVEKQEVVKSAECFGCMTCISRCPSKGALEITAGVLKARRPFNPLLYPLILIVLFYLVIGAGMITGNWHSSVTYGEYQRLIPAIKDNPEHPGSFRGP